MEGQTIVMNVDRHFRLRHEGNYEVSSDDVQNDYSIMVQIQLVRFESAHFISGFAMG